jgi:hypothetical protein
MSITLSILQFYARYTEKPWRPTAGTTLSGEELRELEATVGPILAELEALRRETLRKIDQRAIWMVPGGALAGAFLSAVVFAHSDTMGLINYVSMGSVLGGVIAFTSLHNAYKRAYKNRVIPHLSRRFGDLSYRPAHAPHLGRLVALGVLPQFGKSCIEDEIFGTYRGVELSIVEAKLETGGKSSSVRFNGLLVSVRLPGRLNGTTLVVRDGGLFGGASPSSVLQRVRLEDPRFEDRYQVYGSDQIAARALLTPAVMERLMALGIGGEEPRLLADKGIIAMALGRDARENYFEPPSLADPVRGGEQLTGLSTDIGAVLKLVDAVLDMAPLARPEAIAAPGSAGASTGAAVEDSRLAL